MKILKTLLFLSLLCIIAAQEKVTKDEENPQLENEPDEPKRENAAMLSHIYGSNPLQFAMYGNHPALYANMMMNPYMYNMINPGANPNYTGLYNPMMMAAGLHPFMNPFFNPLMGGASATYGPNNVYNSGENID
jgi:hypothetical protein